MSHLTFRWSNCKFQHGENRWKHWLYPLVNTVGNRTSSFLNGYIIYSTNGEMPIDRANKSYIVRIVQQEKLQGFPYIMLPGKYAVRKAKRLWEEPKLWSNPSRNAGLNHPKHRSCDSARSGTFGWPVICHNHPSPSCRRAGAVFLVIPEDWHMQLVGESTNEIRWTQQFWPDMAWWCVVHNTEIRNARVPPGGKACLAENWLVLSGAFIFTTCLKQLWDHP